ncbi:MAG: glutaredoxin family protein [Patescibacteria group bacterium]
MSKVIIYSTPTCVYCKMAKALFKEKNVAYEEKDVATDLKAREEMVNKSGQLGVPVIDIDGKVVVGFDKGHLMELLDLK